MCPSKEDTSKGNSKKGSDYEGVELGK